MRNKNLDYNCLSDSQSALPVKASMRQHGVGKVLSLLSTGALSALVCASTVVNAIKLR